MKHIMISIKPEGVEKILRGEKILEIRKSMPKDLPCKVYIYCTKSLIKEKFDVRSSYGGWRDPHSFIEETKNIKLLLVKDKDGKIRRSLRMYPDQIGLNGKVIASFTLMHYNKFDVECLDWWDMKDIMLKNSCLTEQQLKDYLGDNIGYAWHIEDLHIYDTPKELAGFGLKRPPQSWCYIEGENRVLKKALEFVCYGYVRPEVYGTDIWEEAEKCGGLEQYFIQQVRENKDE